MGHNLARGHEHRGRVGEQRVPCKRPACTGQAGARHLGEHSFMLLRLTLRIKSAFCHDGASTEHPAVPVVTGPQTGLTGQVDMEADNLVAGALVGIRQL